MLSAGKLPKRDKIAVWSCAVTDIQPSAALEILQQSGQSLQASIGGLFQHLGSRSYVVFMTGRCGSTLLTSVMRDLNAGNPEEFFNEEYIAYWLSRNPGANLSDYISAIRELGSRGGLFGCEIDPLRLSRLIKWSAVGETDLLHSGAGYIWLTREDIVAQAISYATAKRSGVWHNFGGPPKRDIEMPAISHDDIWSEILSIYHSEWWMQNMFLRNSVVPLRLTYEQLICERATAVGRVFSEVGRRIDFESNIEGLNGGVSRLSYSGRERAYMDFVFRYRSALNCLADNRLRLASVEELIPQIENLGGSAPKSVRNFPLPT